MSFQFIPSQVEHSKRLAKQNAELPDHEVQIEGLAVDPTDFGGKPEEREFIVQMHRTQKGLPQDGIRIDATAPLARVVDDILSRCQ